MLNLTHSFSGILLAVTSAVLFSTKTIFIKLAYQYQVDPISLLTLRMLFSLPFFIFVAFYTSRKKGAKAVGKNGFISIISLGIVGYYLASLFDFIGLQYISAGLGRLILFLYPTLILIISSLFLKHQITKKEIFALILSYIGIGLVCIDEPIFIPKDFYFGIFLVFLSAFCYAIYLSFGITQIKKIGSNRYTALAMSVSCIAVVLHFLSTKNISDLIQVKEVYFYAIALCIFSTVLPAFLMSEAINQLGAVKTSLLSTFGPIATIFFATLFLDEKMSFLQILGVAIILIGIIQIKSIKQKIKTPPVT